MVASKSHTEQIRNSLKLENSLQPRLSAKIFSPKHLLSTEINTGDTLLSQIRLIPCLFLAFWLRSNADVSAFLCSLGQTNGPALSVPCIFRKAWVVGGLGNGQCLYLSQLPRRGKTHVSLLYQDSGPGSWLGWIPAVSILGVSRMLATGPWWCPQLSRLSPLGNLALLAE